MVHAVFQKIENAFRGFQLPKALLDDEIEYPHEQTEFATGNLLLVVSPAIGNPVRHALNDQFIAGKIGSTAVGGNNNLFSGWASHMVTNYL